MQAIKPIRDLNDISPTSRPGIHKRWPAKNALEYELLHDYLKKVAYSIFDFNNTIADGFTCDRKDTVYLITAADWIEQAVKQIPSCFLDNVIEIFAFSKKEQLAQYRKYFRALRSFVLAHPLNTNQHKQYGLDGNYICIDIGPKGSITDYWRTGFYRITPQKFEPVDCLLSYDVVLSVYSKADGAELFQHIGFDMTDVRDMAALCIDYLYELDRHISRLKRKDFQL